jgi:hypothetical protein
MSPDGETRRLIDLALRQVRVEAGELPALWLTAWEQAAAPMPVATLRVIAAELRAFVTLDLAALAPDCVFRPEAARVLLILLLLAVTSLPQGGRMRLAGSADDAFLLIEGPQAGWPSGMGECLANAASAQAALDAGDTTLMSRTALLAHSSGVRLSFMLATQAPGRGSGAPPMIRMGG